MSCYSLYKLIFEKVPRYTKTEKAIGSWITDSPDSEIGIDNFRLCWDRFDGSTENGKWWPILMVLQKTNS